MAPLSGSNKNITAHKKFILENSNYFVHPHKTRRGWWQMKRGYRKGGRVFDNRDSAVAYGMYRAARSKKMLIAFHSDKRTYDVYAGSRFIRTDSRV